MMTSNYPIPANNNRIGFQYFPDSLHYREADLLRWLPELVKLGAKWVVLNAPIDRAIPEDFIRSIIAAGIEPVLHFRMSCADSPKANELAVLFRAYAGWGVHYVCLYDRPNTQQAWTQETWLQRKLVERFLDIFIPAAEQVCEAGMYPVLSPLEPGGNFWDTAFLRGALKGIQRREHTRLLQRLVIGAYAYPNGLPLNWGAGGPDVWPGTRPYYTPDDEQDHLGFRIFDWYNAISTTEIEMQLPILLMGTGEHVTQSSETTEPIDAQTHAKQNFVIARLLAKEIGGTDPAYPLEIPDNVLGGCFTLLAATGGEDHEKAWYLPNDSTLPIIDQLKNWAAQKKAKAAQPVKDSTAVPKTIPSPTCPANTVPTGSKLIKHYLLLPQYEWGIADWHLEVSQPYIKKYAPTIGFSPSEAALAEKVVVVGGPQSFPPEMIEGLKNKGCQVLQISGTGTNIATTLLNL